MKPEDFKRLADIFDNAPLVMRALGKETKTLLFGYTSNMEKHHVYQENGFLKLVVYNHRNEIIKALDDDKLYITDIIPNKKLYPESCDFEFSRILREKGEDLKFTNYNFNNYQKNEGKDLLGLTINELIELQNNNEQTIEPDNAPPAPTFRM